MESEVKNWKVGEFETSDSFKFIIASGLFFFCFFRFFQSLVASSKSMVSLPSPVQLPSGLNLNSSQQLSALSAAMTSPSSVASQMPALHGLPPRLQVGHGGGLSGGGGQHVQSYHHHSSSVPSAPTGIGPIRRRLSDKALDVPSLADSPMRRRVAERANLDITEGIITFFKITDRRRLFRAT